MSRLIRFFHFLSKYLSTYKLVVFLIFLTLLILPFLWMSNGYADLGGDAGRLYFLDPHSIFSNLYMHQVPWNLEFGSHMGAHMYGILGYLLALSFFKFFIPSVTYLIAFENGIKLSLSFLFMCLFIMEILSIYKNKKDNFVQFVGIIAGFIYVGFVTKHGWIKSLETHHYVFLNIAILYFLLKFILTKKFIFAFFLLLMTFFQSQNFSFSASPQIFSFYPFALTFLFLYCRYIRSVAIPWKSLIGIFGIFLLIHGFHLFPMIATIFDRETGLNNYIFSEETRKNAGVSYFDHNRQSLGKISTQLFQPEYSFERTVFIFVIPLIGLLGFLKEKSKLLSLISIFFLITLFLISANITILGIKIYRLLFSIPGFMMFRSFDEKWHGIFIFFYTLLFAVSFYILFKGKRRLVFFLAGFFVIFSVFFRTFSFFKGDVYKNAFHRDTNVQIAFDIPRDWINSINFVKTLRDDSSIGIFPLTVPYFQIFYGESSGAYVGISTIQPLTGKRDLAGFWDFGSFQQDLLDALQTQDKQRILQIFSLFNIRYILMNSDPRIFKDFSESIFYLYKNIGLISSNDSYNQLLSLFPINKKAYQEGFFEIYEISEDVIRPRLYIPSIIYSSKNEVLNSNSFRSAFVEKEFCDNNLLCNKLDADIPLLSFKKISPFEYGYTLTMTGNHDNPFMIAFLEDFNKHWTLYLNGKKLSPIRVNEYGTGWIIHPEYINKKEIHGVIKLEFQRYFVYGRIITLFGIILLFVMLIFSFKYSKRNC